VRPYLWIGFFIVLFAFAAWLLVPVMNSYKLPRYHMIEYRGVLVRLDTRTGDMHAFALAGSRFSAVDRLYFRDIASRIESAGPTQ
jgi:hypothetical protein